MRRKNLFEDPYGTAHPATQAMPDTVLQPKKVHGHAKTGPPKTRAPKVLSETDDYVEMLWTDGRTGAEYKVKERKPARPQGDFRVVENRYRSVMDGDFHGAERPEDPFAEDRLPPEPVASQLEIEDRIRERVASDTRRHQAMMATREAAVFEADWRAVDEEAFVDPHGRIHERPSNTIGPYGTDRERFYAPAKTTREVTHEPAAHGVHMGPQKPVAPNQDALEERLRDSRGLEVILTNAFRGLFGSLVADHIITRSELSDRRQGYERPVITHILQDYGLLKPLKPAARPDAMSDKPQKPEPLDYAVGLRAIAAIPKGPEAPDLSDLPGAEREALITAVGRTVLHAMTMLPPQQDSERPVPEALHIRQLEIKQMIASAIKPEILRGLVAPDMMADRRFVDSVARTRTGGTTQSAIVPVQRMDALADRPAKMAPMAGRPTIGQFAEFGTRRPVRKALFDRPEDDDVRVAARPASGAGAYQQKYQTARPSSVRVNRELPAPLRLTDGPIAI